MMKTLLISGVADDNQAMAHFNDKGAIHLHVTGSSNFGSCLNDIPGQKQQFCMAGKGKAQPFAFSFWPDVIINEISDADTHQYALKRCAHLCHQQNKPVVNHPQVIMQTRRDHVYQRLHNLPMVQMPKTIRFTPHSPRDVAQAIDANQLSYPILFRQAGDHGGISTIQLAHEADIETAMYRFALDGRPYYGTQWIDFRCDDGLYRKYRLVIVGDQVFLRHVIISDQWLIHSSSREFMADHPHLRIEEQQALAHFETTLRPNIQPTIALISNQLSLDYYGIDCCIKPSGELLIFEANANMNILINHQPSPNPWDTPIANIKQHFIRLVISRANVSVTHSEYGPVT